MQIGPNPGRFSPLPQNDRPLPTARRLMNGVQEEHVECGACSACCHGQLVVLVEGDDPAKLTRAMPIPQWFTDRLRQDGLASIGYILPMVEGGACTYLEGGRCSIYADRPAMCRVFSCVGLARSLQGLTRREVKRRIAKGLVDEEVLEAGKERLDAAITNAARLLGFAVT
jgi:Fe-S-cluster containining protein